MQYLFVFVLGLAILSCKEDLPQAGENEIVIQLNQTISKTIEGKKWTVDFISLDEHSLCPKDAKCIWVGRVIVSLNINEISSKLGAGDLSPRDGETEVPSVLSIDGVKITMKEVFDPSVDEAQWIRLIFEN